MSNARPMDLWPNKRPSHAQRRDKTLRDVQPAAAKLSRAKGKVQRTPSGYPVGHFTALCREANWPPNFNWGRA